MRMREWKDGMKGKKIKKPYEQRWKIRKGISKKKSKIRQKRIS